MTKQQKLLIVEEYESPHPPLECHFENEHFEITKHSLIAPVLNELEKDFPYHVVLLDVVLPDGDGMPLLRNIKQAFPAVQVIMIAKEASSHLEQEALQVGAFDFVCQPLNAKKLVQVTHKAYHHQQLKQENAQLRAALSPPKGFSDLIGHSEAMNHVRKLLRKAASHKATTLITGPSGSGKEVVAHTIHQNSMFHKGAFVVVNCGAIPENLVESELFGYEKGAFTGAAKQTKGKFEQAQNGTIFLDEIGDLPLEAQVKLLRVLQEKEVVRVGGADAIKLNLRVIAATHRNLKKAVEEGAFREDLFYRIALFLIDLPSLDARKEDILPLSNHFLEKYTAIENLQPFSLTEASKTFLTEHSWPGNVRQLENCIHRSLLMYEGDNRTLSPKDLLLLTPPSLNSPSSEGFFNGNIIPIKTMEKQAIEHALRITHGNVQESAKQLKMARVTLYRKIREYGLSHLMKGR